MDQQGRRGGRGLEVVRTVGEKKRGPRNVVWQTIAPLIWLTGFLSLLVSQLLETLTIRLLIFSPPLPLSLLMRAGRFFLSFFHFLLEIRWKGVGNGSRRGNCLHPPHFLKRMGLVLGNEGGEKEIGTSFACANIGRRRVRVG